MKIFSLPFIIPLENPHVHPKRFPASLLHITQTILYKTRYNCVKSETRYYPEKRASVTHVALFWSLNIRVIRRCPWGRKTQNRERNSAQTKAARRTHKTHFSLSPPFPLSLFLSPPGAQYAKRQRALVKLLYDALSGFCICIIFIAPSSARGEGLVRCMCECAQSLFDVIDDEITRGVLRINDWFLISLADKLICAVTNPFARPCRRPSSFFKTWAVSN